MPRKQLGWYMRGGEEEPEVSVGQVWACRAGPAWVASVRRDKVMIVGPHRQEVKASVEA